MKKFIKLMMCIGLLFSISACSSKAKVEEEAIDRLEASLKKFSEVSSFDYTLGVDMPTLNSNVEVYGTFLFEDSMQMSMAMDVVAEEQKLEKMIELYMKDNMMYMSMMGIQQKQEADFSELSDVSFDPDTMNFDREALKENLQEATVNGDTLHLVLKDEFVKKTVESQDTDLSSLNIDEITAMTIDVVLEDDFMKEANFTVTGKSEGKEANFSLYLKLQDINNAKEIAYPDGMEDWEMASDSDFDFSE